MAATQQQPRQVQLLTQRPVQSQPILVYRRKSVTVPVAEIPIVPPPDAALQDMHEGNQDEAMAESPQAEEVDRMLDVAECSHRPYEVEMTGWRDEAGALVPLN